MSAPKAPGGGRWAVLVAILAFLALVAGAVGAGAQTPATTTLGPLPKTTTLDYSPSPPGRLAPLNPSFVAQSLGLSFPTGVTAPAPIGGSNGLSSMASGVNPVSTPVYQCVNGHQTADPLSPPCVAQFSGDNGGSTARGVSRTEVRILVRLPGGLGNTNAPPTNDFTPTETLYDLNQPQNPNEYFELTKLRHLATYFNRHFQLYGRRLHLFAYFDGHSYLGQGDNGDHQRKAALAALWAVNPFAVVQSYTGNQDSDDGAFLDTMARAGVQTFQPMDVATPARFERVLDRSWGFLPTSDQMAELFSSYVCQKMVRQPVALSGNPGENGRSRRFGVLYVANQRGALYGAIFDSVQRHLAACGASVAAVGVLGETRAVGCGTYSTTDPVTSPGVPTDASILARFKAAKVTTVLWLGCNDPSVAPAAAALSYWPEWALLGDGVIDQSASVKYDYADLAFDHHAVAVSPFPVLPQGNAHCYAAQREEDPTVPAGPDNLPRQASKSGTPFGSVPPLTVAGEAFSGCAYYYLLLPTVTALQLGGPRLTADSLATGLHRLPYLASPDPQTPSCFYGSGHACITDAVAAYYDAVAGCFRAIEGGRRYLPGRWPAGNINAQIVGGEPCTL